MSTRPRSASDVSHGADEWNLTLSLFTYYEGREDCKGSEGWKDGLVARIPHIQHFEGLKEGAMGRRGTDDNRAGNGLIFPVLGIIACSNELVRV